jgi:penicillin-binding protein 1A
MARRTKPRSRRTRRQDDTETSPASAGAGDELKFAETSELEFDFSDGGNEAGKASGEPPEAERSLPSEPPEAEQPLEPPDATARGTRIRDRRAGRIDREVPPPPRKTAPTASGDGRGGNGKPPDDMIPPPPAPPALGPRRGRPRIKKLRIALVVMGLGLLAMVSTVFGMMMAVSQDLPAIENFAQFRASKNTRVFDDNGELVGTLSSNQNKILLEGGQISPNVKSAVVAVEDSRFYQHRGVDYQGIGRALVQDVLSRSASQGGSTITQQFVKNALEAQSSRTVFEKLREAALAYHLERKWTKDRILTEYLNTIYFGEGAYGIEAAARTYFGSAHPSCGTDSEPCASVLLPEEAAMLAGIISNPSAYDPKQNPETAKERRDLVLQRMYEQGYITEQQYDEGVKTAIPSSSAVEPPQIDSEAPYFTTWLRQQLVDRYGPGKAFFGGLKVKTTLDLTLQQAAEDAVYNNTAALGGITSSVVVIDNETGGVKAMVGGAGYEDQAFNIATQGARQPGSAWKPFTLVSALELGHSPYEVYSSAPKTFRFGKKGKQLFEVNNYEDQYLGSASIISATQYSDNSVYAELGLSLKETPKQSTRYIANTAHKMGITSSLSVNPAMVLGGLRTGVNPLEMAHAYETLAEGGQRISGTLASRPGIDPVSYTQVTDENGHTIDDNDSIKTRVMPEPVADTARSLLENVVSGGTGQRAAGVSDYQWGKTGTTENNGDAWFCGATESATACVWVGHADSVEPMETEFGGLPVDGGTIPTIIWYEVMSVWEQLLAEREAGESSGDGTVTPSTGAPSTTYSAPAPETDSSSGGDSSSGSAPAPSTPAPQQTAPAPAPTPAPSGGGATGGTGGGISPG